MSVEPSILAYIAGLFDGEGCIYIAKSCGSYGKRYRTYYLSLTITNIHLETLNWIIKVLGIGKIYKRPPSEKQCYVYRLGKMSEILEFLIKVYPYLRIKKSKAKLIIEYCRLRLSKIQEKYNAKFGEEEKILLQRFMECD